MTTTDRPAWDSIPPRVRVYIADRFGSAVTAARVCEGGFTRGLAAVLHLADQRTVFVKGAPADSSFGPIYLGERHRHEWLPAGLPMPAVLWHATAAGWHLIATEYVTGRHPDLSPGSPDIGPVLEAVRQIGSTPCPAGIKVDGTGVTGWLKTKAWPDRAVELEAWEARCSIDGDALVHADIRADNMLVTADDRALVVDWAGALRGAAWLDVASLVPQFIMAGHTPGEAEAVVDSVPGWKTADPEAVTAFAVGACGLWERGKSPHLPPPLVAYRTRAASAGRSWIAHRLGWT